MEEMTAPVNKPPHRGLAHVWKAMLYSFKGLKAAVTYEEAFRLELLACLVLVPVAFWVAQGPVETILLLGSLLLVLIVELINSALEAVVDRVGVEYHVLSGRAKDIGSAAVFIALVNVSVIWGVLLHARFVN